MKLTATTAVILCLLQAAPASCLPPASGAGTPLLAPHEIGAIAQAVTAPAIYIARWSRASVSARVKLIRSLKNSFSKRKAPDKDLVRVSMRLTLRLNNAWLDTIGGYRIYPGTEDFERFAEAGSAAIKSYMAGLPAGHTWGPVDDRAAGSILDRELRRGVNRLPVYRGRGRPPEPAPSPEELEYLPGNR